MCNSCGHPTNCNCPQTSIYPNNNNWYTTSTCIPCSTTEVCKKQIPAKCVFYKGPNLANIGLTTNQNLELILYTFDSIIGSVASNDILHKDALLVILNDINTRLNTITGGTHAPYTL